MRNTVIRVTPPERTTTAGIDCLKDSQQGIKGEKPDIPPLSDEYHRARRNLTFASAVLLSWEFVGIDLGNSATLPALDIPVTIRNPQVVPIVIFALVAYFLGRLLIEWNQNPIGRRLLRAPTIDVSLSISLSALAITIYLAQLISGLDVATYLKAWFGPINTEIALLALFGGALSFSLVAAFWLIRDRNRSAEALERSQTELEKLRSDKQRTE